jgi:succinate dehydrogenase / fumarate reductase cytochrome b subunit
VETARPESWLARVFRSTIGLKMVMAATGVVLSVFVLGHMLGNLTAFRGAEAMDAYGATLRKVPVVLWAVRLGLLVSVGLHIWAYLALTKKSWEARQIGYQKRAYREATYASRTMRITGPLLAAFVVYHLMDLTVGKWNPDFREGEVYHNLIASLSLTPVAVFYLLAVAALALHLWHGVWSMFQSLGISQPRHESFARRLATLFTILVVGGFALIPLAILAGRLK